MSLSKRVFSRRVVLSALLVFASVATVFQSSPASAAQITTRSLTLAATTPGVSDGGSKIGGNVNHVFTFTVPSVGNTNIGSIQFEYCTTASVATCVMPTGMLTNATNPTTLSAQSGATGFTLVNTTNGAPYITRTAASVTAGTTLSYTLSGVTNPTTTAQTFFVRITTYTAAALGGSVVDTGSVAAATTNQIILTGTMPESLIFCAGGTVSTTSSIPDCTTATSGAVSFNQLFSPTDTATATSQMAASTNANGGYAITVNGLTLTSGLNTIPAMTTTGTGDASVRGTGQFGLNLKLNTVAVSTIAVGAEVAATPNGTSLRGQSSTGYASVDNFRFVTGDTVARSDNGGAGPTNAQIFTSSYIVNVAGNQASGTYTSTLTYICTGTF
jgi:hypothetical protein